MVNEWTMIFLSLSIVITNMGIYRLMRRMESMEMSYIEMLLNSKKNESRSDV